MTGSWGAPCSRIEGEVAECPISLGGMIHTHLHAAVAGRLCLDCFCAGSGILEIRIGRQRSLVIIFSAGAQPPLHTSRWSDMVATITSGSGEDYADTRLIRLGCLASIWLSMRAVAHSSRPEKRSDVRYLLRERPPEEKKEVGHIDFWRNVVDFSR